MADALPISVPADVLNSCALERWAILSPEKREEVATVLAQVLAGRGYAFTKWRMEDHGQSEEQPVLIFTDARSRLDFVLVPGGTLLPGYDDAQLQRYIEMYKIVERRDDMDESDEEDADLESTSNAKGNSEAQALYRPMVFASETTCDLSRKPSVPIAPFLMATTPVLAETQGIKEVITLPGWWRQTWEEMATDHLSAPLRWEMVAPILDHYDWEVPTTQEWEWASQGGKSGIFYWGNEIPRFVVNPIAYYADEEEADEYAHYSAQKDAEIDSEWSVAERSLLTDAVRFEDVMRECFSPSTLRRWPYANNFGLVGLLACGEWCAPSDDQDDSHPLIARGGAAAGFPWQSCHEWLLLLRAAESRLNARTTYGDWRTLRPILRLQ